MAATFQSGNLVEPLLQHEDGDAVSPSRGTHIINRHAVELQKQIAFASTDDTEETHHRRSRTSIQSNASVPLTLESNKVNGLDRAYSQKQRSFSYHAYVDHLCLMHQATLRHLATTRFNASKQPPGGALGRMKSVDLVRISKYALDNVREEAAADSERMLTKEREFERLNFDPVENEIAHLDSMTRAVIYCFLGLSLSLGLTLHCLPLSLLAAVER